MTAWDIYARLRQRGHTLASVGRGLDPPVSRNHVRHVLHGIRQSRRVEEALAEAAGLSLEEFYRLRKAA